MTLPEKKQVDFGRENSASLKFVIAQRELSEDVEGVLLSSSSQVVAVAVLYAALQNKLVRNFVVARVHRAHFCLIKVGRYLNFDYQ